METNVISGVLLAVALVIGVVIDILLKLKALILERWKQNLVGKPNRETRLPKYIL